MSADRPTIDPARLDAHYREAVALADAARSWFDGPGRALATTAPPAVRARFAAISLATTARLMAAMAWLLHPGHAAGAAPHFHPWAAGDFKPASALPLLAGTRGEALAQAADQLTRRLEELCA